MFNKTLWLIVGLGSFAMARGSYGQWVEFAEETGSRLTLSTVALNDPEEKDIATADFDKDGLGDIIVVRKERFSSPGARLDVLLMNEGGVLVDRTTQFAPGFALDLTDARDVVCADFDNDAWVDIVIATTFDDAPKFYRNLGNDGMGDWLGFADESNRLGPVSAAALPYQMCAVSAGDVDGDTSLDLMFSNYRDGGDDVLMINDGNGFFVDETAARLAAGPNNLANVAFGTQNAIVDMDNDNDNDIVKISTLFTAAPFGIGTYILWNDGTGHFTGFEKIPGNQDYMFSIADFDANGSKDIYIGQDPQDSEHMSTILGPQNVTWDNLTPNPSPRTSSFAGNIHTVNIDKADGVDIGIAPVDTDIQNCTGPFVGQFTILRNDGSGAMSDPWLVDQPIHGQNAFDFAFIDLNNDRLRDLFFGNCDGYSVFIQQCSPAVANDPACAVPCDPADGDMDGNGATNGLDIRDFVDVLLGGGTPDQVCSGDFDGQNGLDVNDIPGMVNAMLNAP